MDDEMVSCPYNKDHRIVRYRMPYHLIKCKKQYVGKQLESCPFNAMHLVEKKEMTAHIKQCPDYLITVENEMANAYTRSRATSSAGQRTFSSRPSSVTTSTQNGKETR